MVTNMCIMLCLYIEETKILSLSDIKWYKYHSANFKVYKASATDATSLYTKLYSPRNRYCGTTYPTRTT